MTQTMTPVSETSASVSGQKLAIMGLSAYYGGFLALQDITMSIEPRAVTAFIGPSGCGKSTLLRTINRLHEVTPGAKVTGSVRMAGTDLYDRRVDPVSVRRKIGMVFQRPNLFPTMSIKQNVTVGIKLQHRHLPKSETDDLVELSLRAANLWDSVKDRLNKPGTSLSGGQQQRLCIARVIAVEPEVILLDEPCSALDPISTAAIEDLISNLRRDYTVVIVTHNMQQAGRISDFTAFFLNGCIIETGDTIGIFSNPRNKKTEDYITGRFG